jgi:hypothetical protein
MENKIEFYGDKLGIMSVIAPKGWHCSGSVGADGFGTLVVVPPGGSSSSEAVETIETSACLECRLMQACPLFTTAYNAMRSDYHQYCAMSKPSLEATSLIRPGIMSFVDPPRIKGDGAPSGGPFVADGVMTFYLDTNAGSWLETCTLPDRQHSLCQFSLKEFVSLYGND